MPSSKFRADSFLAILCDGEAMDGAVESIGLFPEWTWIVGLLIGASIGSFLNVVIYRMPRGLSVKEPKHSFCPSCKHQLGVPDLFPLLSWLFSRGKCRHCGSSVSPRYFIVELFTGGLFAGFWYQWLIAGWEPARAICLALFSRPQAAVRRCDVGCHPGPMTGLNQRSGIHPGETR